MKARKHSETEKNFLYFWVKRVSHSLVSWRTIVPGRPPIVGF